VDPRSPYFNSGVLLLDLAQLRRLHATALYKQAFRAVKAKQADQSILNVVAHGRWHALPARWNRQILLGSGFSLFADEKGGIWHFTSRIKPWQIRRQGTRGLVAECHRELDRAGWTIKTEPQTVVSSSRLRDATKGAHSWLRAQLRGSKR
jgi:lipopolysaccharide biosynthesis glycosyltransferase